MHFLSIFPALHKVSLCFCSSVWWRCEAVIQKDLRALGMWPSSHHLWCIDPVGLYRSPETTPSSFFLFAAWCVQYAALVPVVRAVSGVWLVVPGIGKEDMGWRAWQMLLGPGERSAHSSPCLCFNIRRIRGAGKDYVVSYMAFKGYYTNQRLVDGEVCG